MAIDGETIKKNISKNITKYREKAGLSQKEFARSLNTTSSRVSNWEQGANCPSIDILFEVCKILNVSINDIYGVYPNSSISLSFDEQEHIKKYRTLDDPGRQHVDTVLQWETDRMSQLQQSAASAPAATVPARVIQYYQRLASAGSGQVVFDGVPVEPLDIPDKPEYRRVSYAVGVNGQSMAPVYEDGDILLVEPTCQIEQGEVGIFIVGDKAYVKELGKTELISKNKEYKNIPLTEDTKCMGRVVDKLYI